MFRTILFLHTAFMRHPIIGLLIISFIFRFALFVLSLNELNIFDIGEATFDSKYYIEIANYITGDGPNNESALFNFGFGYGLILATQFLLFGVNYLPVILIQLVASSFLAPLIYSLSIRLSLSESVSLVAGLIMAMSATSICLATLILSDTYYALFFVIGVIYLIRALDEGKLADFVLTGLFVGVAILIRPIGVLWPVVISLISICWYFLRSRESSSILIQFNHLATRTLLCVAVIFAIISPWIVRNYYTHGIPTMTFNSADGPASIASWIIEEREGTNAHQEKVNWLNKARMELNSEELSLATQYRVFHENAMRIIAEHPGDAVRVYLHSVADNVTAINYLHQVLIPSFTSATTKIEVFYKKKGLNYVTIILSLVGLLLMVVHGRRKGALVLGVIMIYYALMCGLIRGQGSRLFFPGQIATSILSSYAIIALYDLLIRYRLLLFQQRLTISNAGKN